MKKILAIAVAVVMIAAVCSTVSFAASEPALLITAEQLADESNLTTSNNVEIELKEENGVKFARITATGGDPHFYFGTAPETDVANKYAAIKYRTTTSGLTIDAYMYAAEPHTIFGEVNGDGNWNYLLGDLSQSGANWTGKFARFDPLNGNVAAGDVLDIEWIAVFADQADAEAYRGSTGSSSEQPASSEKGEDQWLCGEEPSAMSPGWWFNPVGEPDDRYVTVTFTATSNFSGVKGFYYCSNVDNGYTLAHMNVALVKDGNVVADAELASNGDNWAETDFGKTFGPGEYTLRYTCKSGSGVENDCWCVIGVAAVATDVVVEANVNAPAAGSPVLMLIGADAAGSSQEPGGNPTTADAAVIAIAAVACIALAGVVIAKKVR